MTYRRRTVVALGAAGLLVGVGLAFAPEAVPRAVREPARSAVESLGDDLTAAAVSLVGLAAALWIARSSDGDAAGAEPLTATPPEAATAETTVAGGEFDAAVERVGERDLAAGAVERGEPATRLRETARTVLSRTRPDDADVEGMIAAGAWTDDRVAAAFLGDERAPGWTFRERLRAWLAPERETERRAARTVAALGRELERHEQRWHRRPSDGTGDEARDAGEVRR
ncbi:hypothetical protein G9464_11920 [Halostella sp. JP-L12]|uniref:DUF7269 family protein n=1 Tax=Halostella TaxID=1843185 RepID=UPI000EF7CD7C|nr:MULTISPECIES: hypothetical protein [Halostella]NHN48299.1 hypothetical protein [Halostella sp. JP-L12]